MNARVSVLLQQLSTLVMPPTMAYVEALAFCGCRYALWKADSFDALPVDIGDVGFITDGAWIKLFNVTKSWDDPSNQCFRTPGKTIHLYLFCCHCSKGNYQLPILFPVRPFYVRVWEFWQGGKQSIELISVEVC